MKAAIVYASKFGRTRRVVTEVKAQLAFDADVYDVKDLSGSELAPYDLLMWFCPTYGDEELHDGMEAYLRGFNADLSGKKISICELGNYYGYDDFQFGAMRIIRAHLLSLKASEICEPLSLDSFPRVAWDHLSDWVKHLNKAVNGHG